MMTYVELELRQAFQFFILGALILAGLSNRGSEASPLQPSKDAREAVQNPAVVEGHVIDKLTGEPIPNALITLPDFQQTTRSDDKGFFRLPVIQLGSAAQTGRVLVAADPYGDWEIEDVWLVSGDILILTVELASKPQRITVPPPKALRTGWPTQVGSGARLPVMAADQMDLPLPDTITVRVSGNPYCNPWSSYELETVDFKEYVKHVLPNEWLVESGGETIGYWESMRAGAVAVKMYAWYWIAQGGKWDDADVWDSTCDQVYNPAVEYASSNAVIEYTWNWRLTREGELVETNYRTYHSQCPNPESCMGQIDADQMAANGELWNDILAHFYQETTLSPIQPPLVGGGMLRFFGNGYGIYDRVRIRIDNPNNNDPGPPADVGAGDFTIELWLKGTESENLALSVVCGANQNWIYGNVFLDRERRGNDRHFGLSLAGGKLVFGVTGQDTGGGAGQLTLCSTTAIGDGAWHHIAVQRRRSDGFLWLFVDGQLEASGDGPDGDLSYPDDASPNHSADPYLIIGAGKRDDQPGLHPPFSGWIDEVRLSNILRYSENFNPQANPFSPDANSAALYHFDELLGNFIQDSSGAPGGPSHGERRYGGGINGPDWFFSDLYLFNYAYLPYLNQP